MTVFQALTESLLRGAEYNKADQVTPVVVLWPDKERQWEPLIERLRVELPLLTLGSYDPATKTGPAIYLRCLIASTLPDANGLAGQTPILYLPGISRAELSAVEDCPPLLQPLAELQYRGVFFTQKNGKDGTLEAFLRSADGGLEINVSTDSATREAMRNALLHLADESIVTLQREAPLTVSSLTPSTCLAGEGKAACVANLLPCNSPLSNRIGSLCTEVPLPVLLPGQSGRSGT